MLIDRDDDNCHELKKRLEATAETANLVTRSQAGDAHWQVVNRIVVEELEAWYFGDWAAVRRVYPRVPATVPKRAKYRNPDAVHGGTWEAFQRIVQRSGYFAQGLDKHAAASRIGKQVDPRQNNSNSFAQFRTAILEVANYASKLA